MFNKKYVRVEALAIQKAFELVKEAKITGAYLARSLLSSEQGRAKYLTTYGEISHNDAGRVVRYRFPSIQQLNLSKAEIGEFIPPTFYGSDEMWLERHYILDFNNYLSHKVVAAASITLIKETKTSDWTIKDEDLWKVQPSNFGGVRWVCTFIRREYCAPDGKLRPTPILEIYNPATDL